MARSINKEARERKQGIRSLRQWISKARTALNQLDRFLARILRRKSKDPDEADLIRIIKGLTDFNNVADFIFKAISLLRNIFRF